MAAILGPEANSYVFSFCKKCYWAQLCVSYPLSVLTEEYTQLICNMAFRGSEPGLSQSPAIQNFKQV